MNIKEIVKGNTATFSFYRQGYAYYSVDVKGVRYQFPVELVDAGSATLFSQHKAIELMRWIRKALEDRTFIKAR